MKISRAKHQAESNTFDSFVVVAAFVAIFFALPFALTLI